MTYNDRIFVAAEEICPPVVNQLFFEGTGEFDINRWRDAVKIASDVNPGSRLVLKGHLCTSRWIDSGTAPPVSIADGRAWDGTGPEGAPFLEKRFNLRYGPTCEVLLINGSPLRVCFRTHHAVMDGMGTLTWAEDIFRVLRNEKPRGSYSVISDYELARSQNKEYRKPFPRNDIAPTGKASADKTGLTWKRVSLKGRYNNFLGQVAVLAAAEARKHGQGPVHFAVPVDLRPISPGLRSTGNLAVCIYVEVTENSTPEKISQNIKDQLHENRQCMIDRTDPLFIYIPMSFLVYKGKAMMDDNKRTGRYGTSGMLTNMGIIPVDIYSGGGFKADTFWGIPPNLEYYPFFMGMAGGGDSTSLILSMPVSLADNNRLDTILENIVKGLVPSRKP